MYDLKMYDVRFMYDLFFMYDLRGGQSSIYFSAITCAS